MQDRQLLAFVTLLAVTVGMSMILHWFVVCRDLYKSGERFPTGLLIWRQFHELRLFKDLRAAQSRSLTVYYVSFILIWFNLLLLFIVVGRVLWEKTHPYGSF